MDQIRLFAKPSNVGLPLFFKKGEMPILEVTIVRFNKGAHQDEMLSAPSLVSGVMDRPYALFLVISLPQHIRGTLQASYA